MSKLLIIHTWGIGDLIMITPALIDLKMQFPEMMIDFVFFQKNATLPIINSNISNKIYFGEYKLIALLRLFLNLNRNEYDYSFITSGVTPWKAMIFNAFLNSKYKIGEFRKFKLPFFDKRIAYNKNIHRLQSTVKILQSFLPSFDFADKKPIFPLSERDVIFAKDWINTNSIKNRKMIGFHHGSNKKAKNRRWPYQYFIMLIKELQIKYPQYFLFLVAGNDEIHEGMEIVKETGINIVYDKTLGEVAAVISLCDIFINTDSVMGHIASCFDCEIFTIFGPADPVLTHPVSNKSHIMKLERNLPCQPCEIQNPRKCGLECLYNLIPELALKQLNKYLD